EDRGARPLRGQNAERPAPGGPGPAVLFWRESSRGSHLNQLAGFKDLKMLSLFLGCGATTFLAGWALAGAAFLVVAGVGAFVVVVVVARAASVLVVDVVAVVAGCVVVEVVVEVLVVVVPDVPVELVADASVEDVEIGVTVPATCGVPGVVPFNWARPARPR